jgi:tetratricopeptide (TPR) repeat protein
VGFFWARWCAAAPTPQGELLEKEGSVDLSRAKVEWSSASVGQKLFVEDRLRTLADSRATLQLAELGRLRLKELTTMEVLPPLANGGKATLDLKNGAFYFFTRERPREFLINTPYAVAASRGTEVMAAVDADGQATFTVFDGQVDVTNNLGGVTLATGDIGTVAPGQAPVKTAVIQTTNLVQWWLYYPAVLDQNELSLTPQEQAQITNSLSAYRAGDLLGALADYPKTFQPQSDGGHIYLAELWLAVGEVEKSETELSKVGAQSELANAIRELMEATSLRTSSRPIQAVSSASDWLARSYSDQARHDLSAALQSARNAAAKDPGFGFAWERVAELEFGFGRTEEALDALEKSIKLSSQNAQAWALKGFLAAARNQLPEAEKHFEQSLDLDGALGNAWLGRGLVRIRQGQSDAGRGDLQTAAALEPNRSELRSYLGKAFDNSGDALHADRELKLAKRLDPSDPTPWLYSALYLREELRFNEALEDLERSLALNDNRQVYRSQLLLDQDRAVRGSSLATIYQSANMNDVSVREAIKAVESDYSNPSAHQFLAESFDAQRDPTRFNLRIETPWFNELLLAHILAPVGAGNLSQNISQQEYSRLFEDDRLGFSSSSEYRSDGQFRELASQYGTEGNSSYALDLDYQHNDGIRPNNELNRIEWYTTLKQQLTPQDSVLLLTKYFDYHSGDNFQRYDQSMVRTNYQLDESQTPLLAVAYHHEWQPGVHTLFLGSRLEDNQRYRDAGVEQLILFTNAAGQVISDAALGKDPVTGAPDGGVDVTYQSRLEIYSAELNQIFQGERNTVILGGRFQGGQFSTTDLLNNVQPSSFAYLFSDPAAQDTANSSFTHESAYAYYTLEPVDHLWLTAGLSFDHMTYPDNFRLSPISSARAERTRYNPKAALVWNPLPQVTLRGAFSKSLSGASFDESFTLEPTELAGFNQSYRTIISESLVGEVSAQDSQVAGGALDLEFPSHTYVGLQGEMLGSQVDRGYGVFDSDDSFFPDSFTPSTTRQSLDYHESSISATVNQLASDMFSIGAKYKFTHSVLQSVFPAIPLAADPTANISQAANLHQTTFFILLNHPSGFFAQAETQWYHQDNFGYTPSLASANFWQHNILFGYRLRRQRAELSVGVLNLGNSDYDLNPLNLYQELPRGRVFFTRVKINL